MNAREQGLPVFLNTRGEFDRHIPKGYEPTHRVYPEPVAPKGFVTVRQAYYDTLIDPDDPAVRGRVREAVMGGYRILLGREDMTDAILDALRGGAS